MRHFDFEFHGFDGNRLHAQGWLAKSPVGTLLVTHGQAEHSGCYRRFATHFVPAGWNVFAWDLRGHGESAGKRGFVGDFLHYVDDFRIFVKSAERISPELQRPLVLVGHSMGGLITLRAAVADAELQKRVAAICLSSPFMGLALRVPKLKHLAANLTYRVWPSLTLNNEISYADLTRDQGLLPEYEADQLRHDRISPGAYLGAMEAMDYVRAHAGRIELPLLMQLAGSDRIVNPKDSEDLFERIKSQEKTKKVYADSYHEIFNDINRQEVYRDLETFLKTISRA
jgi:lysophospholipase